MYLKDREADGRERDKQKHTECGTGDRMIPAPRDHDLNQNQNYEVQWIESPGCPKIVLG